MAKQLTTQNATITTATVEIRTLTVSGKQVTLALFRQLRVAALIAKDGTLNGEPWGYVNYHTAACGTAWDHRHVIWQKGHELLCSKVSMLIDFRTDEMSWPPGIADLPQLFIAT